MKKINVEDIVSTGIYLSPPQSFHVEGGTIVHSWISNVGQPVLVVSTCQENGQIFTTDYYTFAWQEG